MPLADVGWQTTDWHSAERERLSTMPMAFACICTRQAQRITTWLTVAKWDFYYLVFVEVWNELF